jgi:hypothetical protein
MKMTWTLGATQRISDRIHHSILLTQWATRTPNRDRPTAASIPDNAPGNGGNPMYLTDYMEELSAAERERSTRAFTAAQVGGNISPNFPPNPSNLSAHQGHTSSVVNRSVDNRDRRAPRTVGSLRRINAEENEAFWDEFDDSRNS